MCWVRLWVVVIVRYQSCKVCVCLVVNCAGVVRWWLDGSAYACVMSMGVC